jgi:hypothetical protein
MNKSWAPAAAGVVIDIRAVPPDVVPFFKVKDDPVAVFVKYTPYKRQRPTTAEPSAVLVTDLISL